jgi:hypothetical protein
MRTNIELSTDEKWAMQALTLEEAYAVIDQLVEQIREDLEWMVVRERARVRSPSQATKRTR